MKQIYLLLLCTLFLGSCSYLEEYSQDEDYVRTYKDLDELLIGDCYMPVGESAEFVGSANPGNFIHLLGDEIQEQNSSSASLVDFDNKEYEFGYYTWQQRVGQAPTYTQFYDETTLWTKLYYLINVANNVLNSAEDVPQDTNDEKLGTLRVKGEAYFLRAYYYWYLANLYGHAYQPATAATELAVPLKTSAEVEDKKFQRNTLAEVYAQITSDLAQAESCLSQQTQKKKSIYRADIVAVLLLRAKVALYQQDWQTAATYAERAIAQHPSLMNLNSSSASFATADNVENIFSMGGNDVPCLLNDAYQSMSASSTLYQLYTTYDLRRARWYVKQGNFIGVTKLAPGPANETPSRTSSTYYYYAYHEGLRGQKAPVSSLFWLRSADSYLVAAEAEALLGNEDKARGYLNTLRANRLSQGADVTSTGENFIKDIRKERQLEFAFEGQRWFDLRRYAVSSPYPQKTSITHDYTYYSGRGETKLTERHRFVLTEDDPAWTLPIPQDVITFNTGMTQNERPWREYTVVSVK